MSTVRFRYENDIKSSASVEVVFDDTDAPFIEDLLNVFEQFLLGMTFQPETIKRYLDTDKVQKALYERAQLVNKLNKPRK